MLYDKMIMFFRSSTKIDKIKKLKHSIILKHYDGNTFNAINNFTYFINLHLINYIILLIMHFIIRELIYHNLLIIQK